MRKFSYYAATFVVLLAIAWTAAGLFLAAKDLDHIAGEFTFRVGYYLGRYFWAVAAFALAIAAGGLSMTRR